MAKLESSSREVANVWRVELGIQPALVVFVSHRLGEERSDERRLVELIPRSKKGFSKGPNVYCHSTIAQPICSSENQFKPFLLSLNAQIQTLAFGIPLK